jgi:hypothetical protein
VTGSEAPEMEKFAPLMAAELTVTGTVPVELNVMGCTTGVFTMTEPKPIDVAFRVSAAEAALSSNETFLEVLPVVAVSIADCALLTEATFAVKEALVVVAGTIT